jgi:hypothetical protein
MDVLIHSDAWSLFIMAIVKQISLLDAKKLLTLQNNVELLIIYVLLHLSPEYCSPNELNGLYKKKKIRYPYILGYIIKSD